MGIVRFLVNIFLRWCLTMYPGWPDILYVGKAGLEFAELPPSLPPGTGIKGMHSHSQLFYEY